MQNLSFRSDIFYSVQNEDYQTELAVLKQLNQTAQLRVLMVASSGENVLSVLTNPAVGRVDAVDLNLAQLQLCELRRTAAELLTRDEQLSLLGSDPARVGSLGSAERLALFATISAALPDPTRAFWEARRENDLAFGVQHVGRNDMSMHDILAGVQQAGFEPLKRPVHDHELATWQAVYHAIFTPAYIQDLFGLPSEALAARIAGIAGYLGECHFRALQQPQADMNPFVTTVFANRYATSAGEQGLPLYLQEQGQQSLRQLGTKDRLGLHHGNLVELMSSLTQQTGPFDLISISNIADWMTEEQFSALTLRAKDCLNPGGAFLARTATGRPMIQEGMAQHLDCEPQFNQMLSTVERGPWFRVIAAGFR